MVGFDLKKRTRWAINYVCKWKDLTNKTIAPLMGVDKGTISNYRTMKTMAKKDFIEKFCKTFDFSFNWFLSGTGEPFPGARKDHAAICGPEDSATGITLPDPGADFIYIPQMSDKISAGTGTVPYNMAEMRVAFRRDWLKRKGDPKNMSLIKVVGDSMEPALLTGDLVLVDHSRIRVDAQGGIYAIAINNEIMIKRVQVIPRGRIKITSDNKNYDPIETDMDEISINGKVIWFARELER